MSFLKKIKELFEKPQSHISDGDWFYHTKTFSRKLLQFYKKIQKQINNDTVLKTGENIIIAGLSFEDTTTTIIKKWGNPRCTFKTIKERNMVHVFFYRRDYIYENTLLQLQFFNNQLFFIGIEVGKNLMTSDSKINMLAKFLPHFISSGYENTESIPIWTDTNKNFLLVDDDVSLNICYLSGKQLENDITALAQFIENK